MCYLVKQVLNDCAETTAWSAAHVDAVTTHKIHPAVSNRNPQCQNHPDLVWSSPVLCNGRIAPLFSSNQKTSESQDWHFPRGGVRSLRRDVLHLNSLQATRLNNSNMGVKPTLLLLKEPEQVQAKTGTVEGSGSVLQVALLHAPVWLLGGLLLLSWWRICTVAAVFITS